jgi:pilus assembly protein CpaB
MQPRAILFIVLALALAGVTANFARSRLTAARQEAVQNTEHASPRAYVLVAAGDLASGSLLHDEDMKWQSWPDDDINDAYLLKGRDEPKDLDGAVVRLRFAKGEPISAGRVIKPGERGFLAAVLAPGMRATSLPLTTASDVAGLILPGDHVDIILSHQLKNEHDPNAHRIASETILTNLRVVAIDQTVNDQDKKPLGGKTATFEVTPKQAEMIEVAKMLGNLSLVLRSAGADDGDGKNNTSDQSALVSHTWDSDVSPLLQLRPEAPSAPPVLPVTVLRGSKSDAGSSAAAAAAQNSGGGSGPDVAPNVSGLTNGVQSMANVRGF